VPILYHHDNELEGRYKKSGINQFDIQNNVTKLEIIVTMSKEII